MNIIGKKNWYFALSLLVIIPGLLSLMFWGLRLSIDFTGGTQIKLTSSVAVSSQQQQTLRSIFQEQGVRIEVLQVSGQEITIKTPPIDSKKHIQLLSAIAQKDATQLREEEYTTVGPTIGSETTTNAIIGILLASLLIVLYIAWSFREIPKPASSWRFGVCAIIALLHDALVLLGIFSLLGHFFGVEVDSLFVTAILTVIGFSVHDTIVVFDRIRENLKKMGATSFAHVVNESLLQTMTRSLNTSLTVILVLFALLLFGGESTRWFIAALLIGIVSGTYSSIFNAAALLVAWQERVKTK
ncbi:MAG TPA: protein translocase subunit SecF [Patescibacteria group bacterium]|nr:protein translocase subunit SecF [Patescibacteria group bacterium]